MNRTLLFLLATATTLTLSCYAQAAPRHLDAFCDKNPWVKFCPEPDADGDGTPDAEDLCPNDPQDLCLDSDGDGIADSEDPCPSDPNNGCLDSDGDGVVDSEDPCPADAADACVDADGDGIADHEDVCPNDATNTCLEPEIDQAFLDECVALGAVLCDPLSTYGPYRAENGALTVLPNPDGTEGVPSGTWWKQWRGVQASGDQFAGYDPVMDALRVTRTDLDVNSGLFTTNFSDDASVQYGPGDTFALEFQVRYNCDYIYWDCDPADENYKTDRRYFLNGSGLKQGSKIAIVGEGDPVIGESAGACERIQIVANTNTGHTLAAFNECGAYTGLQTYPPKVLGVTQVDWQPDGDHACWRVPDETDPYTLASWRYQGTGPDCFTLEPDEWITVRMQVSIGTWQNDKTVPPNSNVKIWAAHEGGALTKVIDHDVHIIEPRAGLYGYGKIWLQMHSTESQTGLGAPDRHAWYRNLVVWEPSAEGPAPEPTGSFYDTLPANEWVRVSDAKRELIAQLDAAGFPKAKQVGVDPVGCSINCWVGGARDRQGGFIIPWGGGHGGSALNMITRFGIESRTWDILRLPSDPYAAGAEWDPTYIGSGDYTLYNKSFLNAPATPNADVLPDMTPTSRHQYDGVWYDPTRNTINTTRYSWWAYDFDTGEFSNQQVKKTNGDVIVPNLYNSLFYDEQKDVVFGSLHHKENRYFAFAKFDPKTGVAAFIKDSGAASSSSSVYARHGRTIYQFYFDQWTGTEVWGEFDMDTETWTHGNVTVNSINGNDMNAAVYIPEWGKILRYVDGDGWYLHDPATKENAPYTPVGDVRAEANIGSKMFYYAEGSAVILITENGVYAMRVQ